MYEVVEHHNYLADRIRLDKYRRALETVVQPTDVVLDLGAGTGILGLLALKAGAARVYSVDRGAILEIAQRVALANGFNEVAYLRGDSTQVSLPEPADVAVCDQMGPFGFEAGLFTSLRDAKARHLRPGATLVPSSVTLQVAPTSSPEIRELVDFSSLQPAGLDFATADQWAVNQRYACRTTEDQLLGPPANADVIETGAWGREPRRMDATTRIDRAGELDGIAGWFVAQLAPGVTMSNSPLGSDAIDRDQAVLPIERPVSVLPDDDVAVTLRLNPMSSAVSWRVRVVRSGSVLLDEAHSTLLGIPLGSSDLARRDPHRKPVAGPRTRARTAVLGWADGTRTLDDIEQACLETFPGLWRSPAETRAFVESVLVNAAE